MKKTPQHFLQLLVIIFFFLSCSSIPDTRISGTIDYVGDAEFYIELTPLHYKYSIKDRIPLEVINNRFETNIAIESSQIVNLVIQDIKYPIYVEFGSDLNIDINRAKFPFEVAINGASSISNLAYQNFLKENSRFRCHYPCRNG